MLINSYYSKQNINFNKKYSTTKVIKDNNRGNYNIKIDTISLQALSSYNKASINFEGNSEEEFQRRKKRLEAIGITASTYNINEDNIDLAERLCFETNEKGKPLFNKKAVIWSILHTTNKSNIDFAEKLCFGKDKDGKVLFVEKNLIPEILRATTEDNITFAERLCFGKSKDGRPLFTAKSSIGYILSSITKNNIKLAEKIFFEKEIDDSALS